MRNGFWPHRYTKQVHVAVVDTSLKWTGAFGAIIFTDGGQQEVELRKSLRKMPK